MPAQQTSFTAPGYDYGADISRIERQRALAQAMQKQSMQPIDAGQTPPGGFVARISPFQGAAKIAQAYSSQRQYKKADEEQRALAEKTRRDLAEVLRRGQLAASGTPATPMSEDASGNVTPAQPAVAPNMGAAASAYMQHPMTAQMGMGVMQKELENQQRQKRMAEIMGMAVGQQAQAPLNPANPNASVMAGSGSDGYTPPTGGAGPAANPFAGMPPQVMAMMTSGDPELVKLGTTLMEANKGIAQRPGAPVVNPFTGAVIAQPTPTVPQGVGLNVGPGGPSAYQVPGYSGAMTGINSIPNPSAPMHKIPTSSGQEIQLTQPEYVQWQQTGQLPTRYGGKPPAQALQPGGTGTVGGYGGPGLGVVGQTPSQADIINQERQKAGGKALDEQFAKDYATFVQGGAQDTAKQLAQLRDVSSALKNPKANLTGPVLGNVPDAVKSFTNPQSVAMRERVEEVVQRSLRSILGAQFTEKEGERLIARAYNPRLSEAENAVRVDRLLTQLEAAYKQKVSAAQYFEKNGTLEGWKGKIPNIGDFDPDTVTGKGYPATIKFSDLPSGR